MKSTLFALFGAFFTLAPVGAEEGFTPLFNGSDLTGWEQHSGKAEYRVEDGSIVGKTVPNTGNFSLFERILLGFHPRI